MIVWGGRMRTGRSAVWRSAALAIAMTVVAPALADQAFDACSKSAAPEDVKCGEAWIAREQEGLDAALKQLKAVADGKVAEALDAEQRAWEAFRDVACTFKLDEGFGGAGGPTGYHACRARLIAERRAAIEGYISYIDN